MNIDKLQPAVDFGKGVYRLTEDDGYHHIHCYHKHLPWNEGESHFLFMRYKDLDDPAEICILELASGNVKVLGTAEYWSHHHAARQMWLPGRDEIIYHKDLAGNISTHAIVDLSGRVQTFQTPMTIAGAEDKRVYVGYINGQGIEIEDRRKFGLAGYLPESGETKLLCDFNRAIEMLPNKEAEDHFTFICNQAVVHPAGYPWVHFTFGNQSHNGIENHRSYLFIYNFVTDELIFMGRFAHHPCWHPEEMQVICFADDADNRRRLALYKLNPDKTTTVEYLNHFSTTGHPSISPDLKHLLVDDYDKGPACITIDLMDLRTQKEVELFQFERTRFGNTGVLVPGDKKAFNEQNYSAKPVFRTQSHPVWNRTGRYFAFNSDAGGKAHVYLVDLQQLNID